jgi:hypothetical protein
MILIFSIIPTWSSLPPHTTTTPTSSKNIGLNYDFHELERPNLLASSIYKPTRRGAAAVRGRAGVGLAGVGAIKLLIAMKRKIVEAPVVDRNYINELHTSIHERLVVLDRLNEDYKTKQEDHFIQSFMNVVEKMGNDLVLAQEAYRNIDIEVKRDQYCMELAAELQFFRTSCFQLKTALEKTEKALLTIKIEKENDDTEMTSIRLSLEKYIKENMALKAENKDLAMKIRQLTKKESSNEKQFYLTEGRSYRIKE